MGGRAAQRGEGESRCGTQLPRPGKSSPKASAACEETLLARARMEQGFDESHRMNSPAPRALQTSCLPLPGSAVPQFPQKTRPKPPAPAWDLPRCPHRGAAGDLWLLGGLFGVHWRGAPRVPAGSAPHEHGDRTFGACLHDLGEALGGSQRFATCLAPGVESLHPLARLPCMHRDQSLGRGLPAAQPGLAPLGKGAGGCRDASCSLLPCPGRG